MSLTDDYLTDQFNILDGGYNGPGPKPNPGQIAAGKEAGEPTKIPDNLKNDSNIQHWYFIVGGLIVAIFMLIAFRNGWFK